MKVVAAVRLEIFSGVSLSQENLERTDALVSFLRLQRQKKWPVYGVVV